MRVTSSVWFAALGSVVVACGAHASIVWSLSSPGAQQSAYQGNSGASTINFDGGSIDPFPGTVSWNSGSIRNADEFGGAGGTGKYFQTSGGALDLHVNTLQYLGFWWSGMGYGDRLTIYRQSSTDFGWSQVFQITGTQVLTAMDAGNAPSTDGQAHARSDYNSRGVTDAYMNIFLSPEANTWQYSIVWEAPGDNMEFDNVTISGSAVPAPGAIGLLGVAGLVGRRRR